jgi:hypothetical protein
MKQSRPTSWPEKPQAPLLLIPCRKVTALGPNWSLLPRQETVQRATRMGALQDARVHDEESEAANHAADQKHSDDFFEIHRSPTLRSVAGIE